MSLLKHTDKLFHFSDLVNSKVSSTEYSIVTSTSGLRLTVCEDGLNKISSQTLYKSYVYSVTFKKSRKHKEIREKKKYGPSEMWKALENIRGYSK